MTSDRSISLKHPTRFYIGGQWTMPSTAGTFDVLDCGTERVAARVARAEESDAAAAVNAARSAFDHDPWPRMTPQERAVFLKKIADRLEALNDTFAHVWSIESGIVHRVARQRIGAFISGAFRQYAAMASTFNFVDTTVAATGHRAYRRREPVGVVAVILPWNGPAGLLAYKVAPALLAGCTVVIKSSPEAPCSAYLFAQVCGEIGLPPGVVNIITAERDVSEMLVRNPGIDKITFTGSTAAGRRISAVASERIARVTLELGGKSPAIVLNDFDINEAANIIGNAFFGYLSGQVCHSLTRVLVPRGKHDAMAEALKEIAVNAVIGDPFDDATQVGPLATQRQLQTVERYVAAGIAAGATLICGGRRPPGKPRGYYFSPTVFANVDNRSSIAQEEIFGPVLCIIPYDDLQHAVRLANDTIYGLNAAVFTHDAQTFTWVAARLRAGSVGHNASRTDFSIGFGGVKQSGLGREGGVEGLEAFLESKTVVMDALAKQERGAFEV